MFNFPYPYGDRYTLNLDWLLETVQGNESIVKTLQDNIENVVRAIIETEFERIFVSASYNAEDESITLEVGQNG